MSGTVNPDYPPVARRWWALLLSIIVLTIIGCAAYRAKHDWNATWQKWFYQRRNIWLIMLTVVGVAIPVILTQRPRPSYLFAVAVFLMAVIGTSVHVLTFRRQALVSAVAVALVVTATLLIPPFYVRHQSGRPFYAAYQKLQPFAALVADKRNRALLGDYAGELKGYLLLPIAPLDYSLLLSWPREQPLARFFDEKGITVFFVQPRIMSELRTVSTSRELLENPEKFGWQKRVLDESTSPQWLLLNRQMADRTRSEERRTPPDR